MTTAIGWFSHCLRHYAHFSGRGSRPEYWWFQVIVWIVNFILHMLHYRLVLAAGILTIIWNLGVVIPHLAVASRRLHNTGHSFWWILPPMIGGFAIVATGTALQGRDRMSAMSGLFLVFVLVWLGVVAVFVYLLCKSGDEGRNRYGDPAPTAPN